MGGDRRVAGVLTPSTDAADEISIFGIAARRMEERKA